jgi:imidazolonepropionase-like amidohydrolase
LRKAVTSLGTVAPGKLADLLVLGANPLHDIRNGTRIETVVINGRVYARAELDAILAVVKRR